MKFDAVIFDMDGLLVDSEPVWFEIESRVLEAHGRRYDPALNRPFIGMRLDEFWRNVVRTYELDVPPEKLMNEVVSGMVDLIPSVVVPMPGANELIAYVSDLNLPRALASSSPVVVIDAIVEAMGWTEFFHTRVSGDQVARGKPEPDVYLEAARLIGAAPERCLALEDSRNGARAAVAAGMTCFAVPDQSHGHPDDFDGITPHRYASLHDVLVALTSP